MSSKNLLLVTIDSLRWDFRSQDAPNLHTYNKESSFTGDAFATGPGTTPSFPAMLTGTYPLSYDGMGPLSCERPSVAEGLRSKGYATAGVHSNPFLSETFGYDRGFERFEDHQGSLLSVLTRLFPQGIEKSPLPTRLVDGFRTAYELIQGKPRPYERAEVVTDRAVDWIETIETPFFEWVHYMDVHHPCFPPAPYRTEYGLEGVSNRKIAYLYSRALDEPDSVLEDEHRILVDANRASLRYVDDQLARLVKALKRRGVYDETLIVITSDHGQLFGEFGAYGKPYRLVDDLLRVPLVLLNGTRQVASDGETPFSLLDLPPLIHEELRLDIPAEYDGDYPDESSSRGYVVAEHQVEDGTIVGARSRTEKYVIDDIIGEERAYEVGNGEEQPAEPDKVDHRLREAVRERLRQVDTVPPEYQEAVDEATERRLEDLGYL